MSTVGLDFQVEAWVTHQGLDGKGNVIYEARQRNHITDEGLTLLASEGLALRRLLETGYISTNDEAPTNGDQALEVLTSQGINNALVNRLYGPPNSLVDWCDQGFVEPTPHVIKAVSQNDGMVSDTVAYTTGATPFWTITAQREFRKQTSDFIHIQEQTNEAPIDQFPLSLQGEASVIRSGGFILNPEVVVMEQTCTVPPDVKTPLRYLVWRSDGMWNRFRFEDGMGTPISYGFGGAAVDVLLEDDGLLRVIYELRIYPPTGIHSRNIDVRGTDTVVQTRAYLVDDNTRWGDSGLLGPLGGFGGWASTTAGLTGSDAFPTDVEDEPAALIGFPIAGQVSDSVEVVSTGVGTARLKYKWGLSKGISNPEFSGGIGGLMFLRAGVPGGSREGFRTNFNPKVQKTAEDGFEFDVTINITRRP
jgi:hypothetical protein